MFKGPKGDGRSVLMLKAIRKRRAFEDIVKQMRQLIEKGRLKEGDQLPTEPELCEAFKVSGSLFEMQFSLSKR